MSSSMALESGATAPGEWRLALPLAVAQMTIAADSPVPINEQICRTLRNAIVVGDLPAGTLLPTSRELAQALSVGRNTVVAAYSRLIAEGYLHSKFRRGTRVAASPQGPGLAAGLPESKSDEGDNADAEPAIAIGFQAQRTLSYLQYTDNEAGSSMNTPDPALYPRAALNRLLSDAFGRSQPGETDFQTTWRRFQTAIAAHFRQARGVNCDAAQIVPVSGKFAALDLAARLLIDPGHAVLIEDPTPAEVRAVFRAAGARIFALPCDSSGADPLAAKGPPARMIYVSPSLNYPLGVQMSVARRHTLLEAAHASGAAIFEADDFAELLYTGGRLTALQGLDREGRVLYFGDLKNTLGPHIRAGFLVVPPNLANAFTRMAQQSGCVPENFVLAAVAGLIETNQYALHVKKIRAAYAERLKLVAEACRMLLPEATVIEPHGGFHLALGLPDTIDAEATAISAGRQGLSIESLSRSFAGKRPPNGILVAFGAVPDRLIESTIRRLAAILRENPAKQAE